jgi:hypothetical protein
MPKAAYCPECAGYVWLGKDGGCVNGHARSSSGLYDAQQDPASGKPLAPGVRAAEPQAPSMMQAAGVLEAGAVSLAAAATARAKTAAANLAVTAGERLQSAAERLATPPAGTSPREAAAVQSHGVPAVSATPAVTGATGALGGARSASIKPLATLTRWACRLFAAYAALSLLEVFLGTLIFASFAALRSLELPLSDASVAFAYLQDGVWVVSAVVFLMWIYRANRNLHAVSAAPMVFTPGWSIGWYFVPIAQLVMPYRAMQEIWRMSHNGRASNVDLLRWWWGLWLACNLAGNVAARSVRLIVDADTFLMSQALIVMSDALRLAASLVVIAVVWRIGGAYRLSFGDAA